MAEAETLFSDRSSNYSGSQGSSNILPGSIGPDEDHNSIENESLSSNGAPFRRQDYGALNLEHPRERPASLPNLNRRHVPPDDPPAIGGVQPPPIAQVHEDRNGDIDLSWFRRCCSTHRRKYQLCLGVSIFFISLLTVATIGLLAYSEIEKKEVEENLTREIYLPPNITYNINDGRQSSVLKSICTREDKIEWRLLIGSCDILKDPENNTEVIVGHLNESESKSHSLYYLLSGSTISIERIGRHGRGRAKIYSVKAPSNFTSCDEESTPLHTYHLWGRQGESRHDIKINKSAYYHVCIFSEGKFLNYNLTLYNLIYNTSRCHECCEESATCNCCMFSNFFEELVTPECVFISAITTNTTVHFTLEIETSNTGAKWLSGLLASMMVIIFAAMIICGIMGCRNERRYHIIL